MKNKEIIDVVILWVNGNDPKWRIKRDYWAEKYNLGKMGEERYRDWNNLMYLFRGIDSFMPWVNHVYLVTDDQIPSWLNNKNGYVSIIDHTEIIDEDKLPTFNSNAIELNIHKIKGLSENFIYFNDDMFVIKPTKPTDFFDQGVPLESSFLNIFTPNFGNWEKYLYNDLSFINEYHNVTKTILDKPSNWFTFKVGKYLINNILLFRWKKFSSLYFSHIPTSFNKKMFEEVWTINSEQLNKVTSNKFRTTDDNSIGIVKFWQIAKNNFKIRNVKFGTIVSITDNKTLEKCVDIIKTQKHHIICINDNENLSDFNKVKNVINEQLNILLPHKSKYERI